MKVVVAGGVISRLTVKSHTPVIYQHLSAGTLPRKSSEFKALRASLISQTCRDHQGEEKVCCSTGVKPEVELL